MLYAFVLLSGLELLVVSRRVWPFRRPLAAGLAITLALVSGSILGYRLSLATILFGIISLYRVVSLLRVVQDRTEEHKLRSTVRRTTATLFGAQVALLAMLKLSDTLVPSANNGWLLLSLLQCSVAVVLFMSTNRHVKTTMPLAVSEHFSDAQLPSLSVCIPARNETRALEACLRSLTASDYPKLEILVLDDCSQGPRTSDIIRGFAHDGVRFIQGDLTPDGWLAKNWAYQQLFNASSGHLVLFCGVDVQFAPKALRSLVTTLLAKDKRMASVLPQNALPSGIMNQLSLLLQPIRYAWELCLPRRMFHRPPVLSSCWIAERKLLESSGSFAAVKNMITPEAHFARRALLRDGYSFIRSTAELSLTSLKEYTDQWETAVRTRYPQLRRRPEIVLLVTLVELSLLIAPLPSLVIGLVQGLWLQAVLSGIALILVCSAYGRVVTLTYRRFLWRGIFAGPLAILVDIYIRHESMWRYEFGEINWKGRNICLPVMRVIPHFPKF